MSIKTGYTDAIELEYLKGNSHTQAFFAPNELRKIENFQDAYNDGFKDWHIHHRLEINPDGSYGKPMEQLLKENLYYHRPAHELIFLTENQHLKMHGRARHNPFGGIPILTIQQQIDLECATWQRFIERKKRMGLL